MMIPTSDIIPRLTPLRAKPISTPTIANGTLNIITNGLINDSNWDAITIYTNMIIRAIRRNRSANISCWSS